MVRLRNALMAVALGTGVTGCAFSQSNVAHYSIWHCDECDDFPVPAYGSGDTMMPGTYTGAPPRDRPESSQPVNSGPDSSSVPRTQQPNASTVPATITPPTPPVASPGLGAVTSPPPGAAGLSSAAATSAESNLPPLPATSQNTLLIPAAHP